MVSSHLILCYARALVNACCKPDSEEPYLFQRPILRLPANGHSWVAVFFLLLGFVNALKPIKLARSGHADLAASGLARGGFSRVCRLILPASLVTTISWVLCQFQAYKSAYFSDAYWLHVHSPAPSGDALTALGALKNALIDIWMFGRDTYYDQPQWAMIHLLQGSIMVITALVLTINMTPRWRTISLMTVVCWSVDWSLHLQDRKCGCTPYHEMVELTGFVAWVGPTCFAGIILAELSVSSLPALLAPYSPILTPPLAIFSLVLMSYTQNATEHRAWSRNLHSFGNSYLPLDPSGSLDRTYGGIGSALLLVSIIISPHARNMLSQKPLKWLGKVSFAIYLVHGTVLRTVFAWILFFGQEMKEFVEQGADGLVDSEWRYTVPGGIHCAFATIISMAVILFVSHVWNVKVEPVLAKITVTLDKMVTGRLAEGVAPDRVVKKDEENGFALPMARVRGRGDRNITDWEMAQQAKDRLSASERQRLVTS